MASFCVKPFRQWFRYYCGLLITFCTVGHAVADDLSIVPYLPNYFSVDYSIDSDRGHSLYWFSNLAVVGQHRISIGYGVHNDTVVESQEELDTRTYTIGYNYNANKMFQAGADFEFWGDSDKITTHTYSAFASLHVDKISISITPQFEDINIYTSSAGCSGSINSKSVALNLIIFPSQRWSLNSGYTTYDYKQNYDDFLNCVQITELPLIISRLRTVADDNQVSIGLDYYHVSETYGINWLRIKSAVDNSSTYVTSGDVTTDIFDDWSITISLGVQENFDNSTTRFVHALLGYYW